MKSRVLLLACVIAGSMVAQGQVQAQYQPAQDIKIQTPAAGSQPVRHADQLRVIPEGAPVMPPNAYAQRSRVPVKTISINAQGTARLVGSVRGLGMDVYQFSGNAGDVIQIISAKATAMEFAIFSPEMGMRFGNHQVLPYSGVYELRIVNNRKDSARNKKPRHYDVTFTLTRAMQ